MALIAVAGALSFGTPTAAAAPTGRILAKAAQLAADPAVAYVEQGPSAVT